MQTNIAQRGFAMLIVGIALTLTLSGNAHAATISAFSDGFESANFNQWTQADTGTSGMWKIDTSRFSGRYSAMVIGPNGVNGQVLRKAIPTDIYNNPVFSFMFKASSLDYKVDSKTGAVDFDRFIAEYSIDGSTWVAVKEVNGKSTIDQNGSWYKVSASVPSSANLQIRFRSLLGDAGDRVNIDDVMVSGEPTELNQSRCSDKIDNDYDGTVDENDADCVPFYSKLSVTTDGSGAGTVTSTPVGISCTTGNILGCVAQFLKTATVSLSAKPLRGSVFSGYAGACVGPANCLVSMEADKYVTATFTQLPSFLLTVSNDPVGAGTVTGLGINCGTDCSEIMYEGENANLAALPARGFVFDHWSGACDTTTTSCAIASIQSDVDAVAHYREIPPGICGNGVIEWNESCDDTNTVSGDGCSAVCQVEAGFTCSGAPSMCFRQISCTGYVCGFF